MTNLDRLQEDLIDYLNQGVDPYDFGYLMEDWNSARAAGLDNQVDLLTEDELKEFTDWLQEEGHNKVMREVSADSPSYLFFSDARAAKKGGWLIHFTNESPFTSFEYGAPGTELGLTVHFVNRKRNKAECPQHEDGSIYDTLYAFAFALDSRDWRGAARKYGRNAVIFQHDYGVQAYHSGDDEEQIIFPICREYNAIPVFGVDAVTGGGTVATQDGEREFDSWQEIVAWATAPKKKSRKKQLAGLAQSGRWAPGVKVSRGTFTSIVRR